MLSITNSHERDKLISFKEQGHIYNVNGKTNFTSVTSVVKKLFEVFNADKIIDKMMQSPNWSNSKYFNMKKNEIKELWKKEGLLASQQGTKMHCMFENYYNGQWIDNDNSIEYLYFSNFVEDHKYLVPYRTEWSIWDEEKKLTGSIDMVFINEDNTISIYDWKRCKNIEKFNNFNKFAIMEPISHIPDTNFWHYCIQLNLYKYILEKNYGFIVKELFLVQIHPDIDNYNKIQVPFMEEEINSILQ